MGLRLLHPYRIGRIIDLIFVNQFNNFKIIFYEKET